MAAACCTLRFGMKIESRRVLFCVAAAAALAAVSAGAQDSTTGQTGQSAAPLPDAPQATPAAVTVPNGPFVVMDTSMGRITCQFYQKQAPNAVANFIGLAEGTKDWTDPATKRKMHGKPFYDGTTFHRVIPEFMIQGGDPLGTGTGDAGYAFDDEFDPGLTFDRPGRLAMANSGPNTNGSQFFITEQAYPSLDMHYTIFGQCDDPSVEVVKTIARVPRDDNDKPLTPVVLNKVTIVPEGAPMPPQPGSEAPPPPPPPPPPQPGPVVQAPSKIVSISAGVAAGMVLKRAQPIYPPDAKAAGVSGTVVLAARINEYGSVESLTVVSGPPALQQAALDAVKTWVYKPYLLNGEPVAVKTTINIIFTLGGSR
jgi:peptidyl-prolyl cis-trans isomerase A (cyclophilin A)